MSSNFGYIDNILLAMILIYNPEIKKHLRKKNGHEDKIYPRFSEKSSKNFEISKKLSFKRKILMN